MLLLPSGENGGEKCYDPYKEEIEPQVWKAVKTLNKKGYPTDSSGFYGKHGERQAIEGQFTLDPHTVYQLYKMDVFVIPHPDPSVSGVSQIFFYPQRPHLKEMKKTWKKVVKCGLTRLIAKRR